MIDLDNKETYLKYDPSGMLAHLRALPEQCRLAWEKAEQFKLPPDYATVNRVIVLGMGGSAVGGELVRGLVRDGAGLTVQRDYTLPQPVDEKTLVIASSYSGATEETLSAFGQALKTPCRKLAITTGGALKAMAQEAGLPVFTIDYKAPPRAALAYSFIPLVSFLKRVGLLAEGIGEVPRVAELLASQLGSLGEDVPGTRNAAKQLALNLFGRVVVIYAGDFLQGVAMRWKAQFNENSKVLSFFETLPEAGHNAIEGIQFPGRDSGPAGFVILSAPSLAAPVRRRVQVVAEVIGRAGLSVVTPEAKGPDKLSQMMVLVFMGDWTSYYLAMLYETDPTPVKSIDYLKSRLRDMGS
jgi:glucose/mannose-6-phosphate isomerase